MKKRGRQPDPTTARVRPIFVTYSSSKMKKELLPSDVQFIIPQFSIWFDFNAERVAMWTARALAATGNTWRYISWEEIEPMVQNDGFWDENKRQIFRKYLPHLDSEAKARRISPSWNL